MEFRQKNAFEIVIILAVIFVSLYAIFYSIPQKQPSGSAVSIAKQLLPSKITSAELNGKSVEELTMMLKVNLQNYSQSSEPDKKTTEQNLALISQARKPLMIALAETNPQKFLQNALTQNELKILPTSAKTFTEQLIKAMGEIKNLEFHNIDESITLIQAMEIKGVPYTLSFAQLTQPLTGTIVNFTGYQLENNIVIENDASMNIISPPKTETTTGAHKLVIILFNFCPSGSCAIPTSSLFTKAQVVQAIFGTTGNPTSVNDFYKQNSFNQLSMPGTTADVYGWYELNRGIGGCQINWDNDAEAPAIANGANIAAADHVLYAMPYQSVCAWSAFSDLGGKKSHYNVSPYTSTGWNDTSMRYTFGHELGHNLGNNHAGHLDCGALMVDVNANCPTNNQATTYGDYYDIMGYYNRYQYNVPHKLDMKWINQSNIQNVSSNAAFDVYNIETQTPNIQGLRIQRIDSGEQYFVEYRQPIGYDSALPTGITRGARIVLWHEAHGIVPPTIPSRTFVLDTTPGTFSGDSDWSDASLSDGVQVYDQINGITFKQLSHNSSYATIQISFDKCINGTALNACIGTLNGYCNNQAQIVYDCRTCNNCSGEFSCNASTGGCERNHPLGLPLTEADTGS